MRFLIVMLLAALVAAGRAYMRRYRYRSPRRTPRDFEWGQAIRRMGAWRAGATV